MSFKIISPGFYSTVQDLGRYGLAEVGLSRSGVMDEHATRWANYLLGNEQDAAVLEITFGHCQLQAQSNTTVVVTGADLAFEINGQVQACWQTFSIHEGDVLSWKGPKKGVRAYLAVLGGLQTKSCFGSRSVNIREKIGQRLEVGDVINFDADSQSFQHRSMPPQYRHDYDENLTLRLLPSYQYEQFSGQQREKFFQQHYKVSNDSDRTGCRLQGEVMTHVPAKMVSEAMAFGSVEITTAGLPIILLNDAPTIGGYPKIGTVLSSDLSQLAQRKAGGLVQFELISVEQAQQARKRFNAFFA
jgi:biotin-dependent carboxylase-like uncharacterized protein